LSGFVKPGTDKTPSGVFGFVSFVSSVFEAFAHTATVLSVLSAPLRPSPVGICQFCQFARWAFWVLSVLSVQFRHVLKTFKEERGMMGGQRKPQLPKQLHNLREVVAHTAGVVRRVAAESGREISYPLVAEVVGAMWRVQTGFGPFDEVQPGPVRWPAEIADELGRYGLAALTWQELMSKQK
jgi:hypothetical protein